MGNCQRRHAPDPIGHIDTEFLELDELITRGIEFAQMASVAKRDKDRLLFLHASRDLLFVALTRCTSDTTTHNGGGVTSAGGGRCEVPQSNDERIAYINSIRTHLCAVLIKLGASPAVVHAVGEIDKSQRLRHHYQSNSGSLQEGPYTARRLDGCGSEGDVDSLAGTQMATWSDVLGDDRNRSSESLQLICKPYTSLMLSDTHSLSNKILNEIHTHTHTNGNAQSEHWYTDELNMTVKKNIIETESERYIRYVQ
eukprot:GHVR01171177.1.p1 GENE.GHVR01171177.1~~GHVR01171177.1.p1  ORF type:complete len:254 (+),score=66.68 GHVR01171177.1:211-972(+)